MEITGCWSTWTPQQIPENAAILNDICFLDQQTGWIAGIKYTHMEFDTPQHVGVIRHSETPVGSCEVVDDALMGVAPAMRCTWSAT